MFAIDIYIRIHGLRIDYSLFMNRAINQSLLARQLILSTWGSQKIHKTIGTPPCTFRQHWHNVAEGVSVSGIWDSVSCIRVVFVNIKNKNKCVLLLYMEEFQSCELPCLNPKLQFTLIGIWMIIYFKINKFTFVCNFTPSSIHVWKHLLKIWLSEQVWRTV